MGSGELLQQTKNSFSSQFVERAEKRMRDSRRCFGAHEVAQVAALFWIMDLELFAPDPVDPQVAFVMLVVGLLH